MSPNTEITAHKYLIPIAVTSGLCTLTVPLIVSSSSSRVSIWQIYFIDPIILSCRASEDTNQIGGQRNSAQNARKTPFVGLRSESCILFTVHLPLPSEIVLVQTSVATSKVNHEIGRLHIFRLENTSNAAVLWHNHPSL